MTFWLLLARSKSTLLLLPPIPLISTKGITASQSWRLWASCGLSVISGRPCVVYTDYAACLSILNSARLSGKLARWTLTI
jgi:hypothetical protein